jgi:hypothetical protein
MLATAPDERPAAANDAEMIRVYAQLLRNGAF